jgi:hypothetical protein
MHCVRYSTVRAGPVQLKAINTSFFLALPDSIRQFYKLCDIGDSVSLTRQSQKTAVKQTGKSVKNDICAAQQSWQSAAEIEVLVKILEFTRIIIFL